MPYGHRFAHKIDYKALLFGGSNVAAKVTVVVQTDDDTVTASCKLA